MLTKLQVEELNALIDERFPPFPDNWREIVQKDPQEAIRFYRFGMAGGSHETGPGFLEWGQSFLDLVDHPVVMQILRLQLGDCFRLDRIFGMRMEKGMPNGRLH